MAYVFPIRPQRGGLMPRSGDKGGSVNIGVLARDKQAWIFLKEPLGGGGRCALRSGAQGRAFSQALLRQRVPVPAQMLRFLDRGEKVNG